MENRSCEVVRDLLPLYVDGVCSGTSKEMVEEHLSTCGECSSIVQQLRNNSVDNFVEEEKNSVLMRHAKQERNAAWKAGAIVSGVLIFPIAILALVLASGHGDFIALPIVISSMMLVASLSVVPLMSKQNRFARAVICAVCSIILVEFFACLSDGESFARTAVPTVFGLSVVFLPFAIKELPLPEKYGSKKVYTIVAWDMLWFFLTLFIETLPVRSNAIFREGMFVSAFLTILLIILAVTVKLSNSKLDIFTKGAVVVVIIGLWISFFRSFASQFVTGVKGMFKSLFELSTWNPVGLFTDMILALAGAAIFFGAAYLIFRTVKNIYEES